MKKCDGKGSHCKALQNNLCEANRPGLACLITINLKNGQEQLRGVYYKRLERDKGVMLNYCPFCGADLRPMHEGIDL